MTTAIRLPRVVNFPVEAGHIRLFARAIGDSNPVYSDADYAAQSNVGGIIAPPTFSEASNHYDEDWPFRPSWEQPSTAIHEDDDASSGTAMHAETHFVYHRRVRPGMVLSISARPGREWSKWGARSGELKFHEVVSEFRDADGAPVLECTTVVLRTAKQVVAAELPKREALTDEQTLEVSQTRSQRPASKPRLRIGDKLEDVLVRRLSRAQIAQYAGVSGDFSPQHVDEFYNTRVAGYPSVFAHGMLTMGMAGRVVTDFIGDGRLKKFGFRFRQQVWPEDSLFAVVEVTGVAKDVVSLADLAITVTNQHGQLIGTGYAIATMDEV